MMPILYTLVLWWWKAIRFHTIIVEDSQWWTMLGWWIIRKKLDWRKEGRRHLRWCGENSIVIAIIRTRRMLARKALRLQHLQFHATQNPNNPYLLERSTLLTIVLINQSKNQKRQNIAHSSNGLKMKNWPSKTKSD